MMGATLPTELIRPEFRRHASEFELYVRHEYGEIHPTWLVKDMDGAVPGEPAPGRRSAKRSQFSLRALAAKVAAALF